MMTGNADCLRAGIDYRCHREERSDVAISWYSDKNGTSVTGDCHALRAHNDIVIVRGSSIPHRQSSKAVGRSRVIRSAIVFGQTDSRQRVPLPAVFYFRFGIPFSLAMWQMRPTPVMSRPMEKTFLPFSLYSFILMI